MKAAASSGILFIHSENGLGAARSGGQHWPKVTAIGGASGVEYELAGFRSLIRPSRARLAGLFSRCRSLE